jgi:hypothetical protein
VLRGSDACPGDGTRAELDALLLDVFEAASVERGAVAARAFADRSEASYLGERAAFGYVPIRSISELLIELEAAPARAPVPPGFEILPRLEGQEQLVYEA